MLWVIVILLAVLVLAIIAGAGFARASSAARRHGADRQRDIHGDVRAH